MIQKLVVGLLLLTIVGAAGVGIYDATRTPANADEPLVIEAVLPVEEEPLAPAAAPAQDELAPNGQAAALEAAPAEPAPQIQAVDMVGETWLAKGTIVMLDDTGFMLAVDSSTEVYVELGQPAYWQAQGVSLAVGDSVFVDGFFNGEQVHAGTVIAPDGGILIVRNVDGQPMWSGGANGGNGQNTSEGPQIAAEDWLTINGTITTLTNGGVTIQTDTGEVMDLQLGQPRFWQAQAALLVGDEVTVLGFWEGAMFQAGEITRLATGERIMLRDPNGRPLWGGPGRTGGTGASGNGAGGQGQQQGGTDAQNGGGNQYRGDRA